MKVLIWFVVLLVPSVITTMLKKVGIGLGFLPTFLLYTVCFFVAKALCSRWEIYDIQRKASKAGMTPFEYVKSQTPQTIIKHLESEKGCPGELRSQINHYVESKSMKKVYADILFEGYANQGELS